MTPVDKTRVNSCLSKHLFFCGRSAIKISPKPPINALSDALLILGFQKFAAGAAKQIRAVSGIRASRGFD